MGASDPPKCKNCGKAHWGTCYMREDALLVASRRVGVAPAPAKRGKGRPALKASSGKSKRADYHREYARKKRAAELG